jgi:hypothetical protein|tara:strand:- start:767 stop:1321 length:555 start_codon:yes stop_codon:yes gene_type:complete
MPNLEILLEDEDFLDMIPKHLRRDCNDRLLINELIGCEDPEKYQRLYDLMSPEAEDVYHKTLDWYAKQENREELDLLRAKLRMDREEINQKMKKINDAYTSYLEGQGLPTEKINWWRKFLLARDLNIAQIFGRMADELEPDESGRFHGLYSAVGYPIREALRDLMLNDEFFGYRLAKLTMGYFT